jgi:mono/diheme cytochrome c family protein
MPHECHRRPNSRGRSRIKYCFSLPATALAVVLFQAPSLSGQGVPRRPAEVTDSLIAQGAEIFHGVGGCFGCHGIEAGGTDSGPALREGVWLHGSDSYPAIISRVVHGIPKDLSLRDNPMPMRGMSDLGDDQVRAVAAYVWWVSHPGKGGGRPK